MTAKPLLVRLADELLERLRPAVGALDGEDVRRVVPPRPVAGELGDRHHLEAVDAEFLQVVEPADDVVERAGLSDRPASGR